MVENKPLSLYELGKQGDKQNKAFSEAANKNAQQPTQLKQRGETPEERATYARLMGLNDFGASGMALELSKMDSAKEQMDKSAANVAKLQSKMKPQEHDPRKVDAQRIMQQNMISEAAEKVLYEPTRVEGVGERPVSNTFYDATDPLYESQGLAAAFKYLDTLPTNEEGKIVVDGIPYTRMELAQALAPQIVSANSGSLFANNATYREDMVKRMGYKNMDSYLAALDQRLAAMQKDLANHVSAQHAIQTPFNDMAGLEALVTQERAGAKVLRDLRDQIKSMRAGEGGFEQFFKGLNEGFDAVNMATFGIADLASEYKQNIVYNKMLNGETLTPEERILADALNIKSDLDALREAQGQSWYNNIGTGVGYIAEIAPQFVGPMLAAKGLFKPINVGAKGAWEMTKKAASKGGFTSAFKTGLGATARVGVKGLNNIARFQINGMLTAPLQASTYSRFLEKRNAQYSIKDGKVTYTPTDAWRDLVDTWIEQGAEVGSELFGVSLEKFTSASLAAIGRNIGLGKVMRKIGGSVRDVETSKAMRFVKSGATKAGQQLFGYAGGVLPETLSEIYGDLTSEMFKSVLTGNGKFEEFKNPTYWATAFALSGIYGGAMSVLPSMADYASYMRDISALGNIKKKILSSGKIEHTDLKNALIALSAGGSIKDATGHLAELEWKNGGYSLEEIGYAMDYIRAEAMQQVRMGEAAESQRLQRFGNVAQNIEAHAYRDEDGTPSGSMVMAVDKEGNSYHILEGDYSNKEATLKALNSEGKVVPLLASNIESLSKASVADVTLFYYQQMFSTEFNMQRLESAEYAIERMDNPTMAQVADVAKRVGIVMPKEGDTITLVDGRTAKVTSISDDLGIMAEMTDGEGNVSQVTIPIMQILSSNTYIAEAQKLQNAEDALELAQTEEAQTEAEDVVEEGDATADVVTEEASNGIIGTEVTLPNGNKGTIVEVDGDDVTVDTGRGVDAYEVYSKEELGMTEAAETTTPQPTQTTAEQTTGEVTPEQATEALNEIADIKPVPTLEDGSIDYEAIDDAETFAKHFEHDMGSREEAIKSVQDMREQTMTDLAEAEKKGKKARSANEKVANKAERQRLAERIAFYDNVLDIYAPKAEAPATPIESAPQVDTTPSQTEAQSPAEATEGVQPSETTAEDQADGYSKYNEKLKRPVGLQHNELSERLEEKTRRMINDVATAFGVEVIFQREVRSSAGNLVNGKIDGSTVYFNWGIREHTLTWLMGHEFTHRMKSLSPEAYKKLRDAVRAYLGEGKWSRLIEKQRKIYEERENPEEILTSAESAAIWEEAKEQTKQEDGSFDEEAAKKLYNKKVAEARREAYIEEVVCDEVGVLARDLKAFDRFLRSEHVRNDGKLLRWLRKVWQSLKSAFIRDVRTFNKVMKTLDELINVSTAEVAKGVEPTEGGEKSSLSAPVFYSNAQYAVQNIKQEKATPEQWLKMIEKNGGLKAGEDKWLGLSDWLKASDKKTLTKDEVLQYIAENDIQIEEVSYGEPEYISENEIYESDAFSNLVASLTDYDEDDNPYINQERYKELQNADPDFLDGFSLDYWGEGLDIDDKMAAARYLGLLGVDNEINNTRLQYTTQGLTKKKEIALVVPTIEPYKQNDEVHFGDAGEGRAVAWVRFGDAEAQRSEEVVRRVDEFETPYKDVNGHEIYRPKDRLYAKDFISYGKLKSGEYAYVVYVNDKQIPVAHKSLEDARNALNEHYKANPEKRTRWDKVLVIDEIQSKRHQEGREKGYSDKSVSQQELYEAQEAAFSKVIDYESALADKYGEDEWAALATAEEMAEYERLRALDEAATNAYENYDKGVPSAPFEKNWAELAMKRMLRYAAENGYDYVAWTTGDQQADRYDIGSVVKDIVAYDTKDVDGNPIKKMKFRMNNMGTYNIASNMEGVIVKGDGEMKEGMRLSDITGKPLAEKIMNGEGEDAMVFEKGKDIEAKSLEGEELHIGNEGMKAFYDQMLPSFVKKYTKKWGAEVGEVTMPDLAENNTMHAVNVTDSMRESVMQGQPKFSLQTINALSDALSYYNTNGDIVAFVDKVRKANDKFGEHLYLTNVVMDYEEEDDAEWFAERIKRIVGRGNGGYAPYTAGGVKYAMSEETTQIFDAAKAKFGTTYDMREAGYILPDGSMLDFSGRHQVRGGDTSFLNGDRTVDHREISDIAYDADDNETGINTDLGDFLDRGAIRIDSNAGAINLNVAPTNAQKDRLKRLIERNDGYVYVDFGKGWDTEHYAEYEAARASRVLGDIDRYFDEGIKPTGNVRYSLSNLPTGLFNDFAEEFEALQKEYESLDPTTIHAQHPFRIRKRKVVQKYVNYVSEVLALPCEVFVLDSSNEQQVRTAYRKYVSARLAGGKVSVASYEEFKNEISDAIGEYFHDTDMVIINIGNADSVNLNSEYIGVVIHENGHKIIEGMNLGKEMFEAIYEESQRLAPKQVEIINRRYPNTAKDERGAELITFALQTRASNKDQKDKLMQFLEGDISVDDILDSFKISVPLRDKIIKNILIALQDGYNNKHNADYANNRDNYGAAQEETFRDRRGSKYNGDSRRDILAPTRYSLQSGDMPFFNDNGDVITFDNTDITGEDYDAVELRSPMPTAPRTTEDVIKAHLLARHNAAKERIRRESRVLRDAVRKQYREEQVRRREGVESMRTNAAKVDYIIGAPIETLDYEAQVLAMIAMGTLSISWESLSKELGVKSGDKKSYRHITNGATATLDAVVHAWWESINGYENGIDTQDLRNALIDVLMQVPTAKGALSILEDRFDHALRNRDEALEDIDREEDRLIAEEEVRYKEKERMLKDPAHMADYMRQYEQSVGFHEELTAIEGTLRKMDSELKAVRKRAERALARQREKQSAKLKEVRETIAESKRALLEALSTYEQLGFNKQEVRSLVDAVNKARSMADINKVRVKIENVILNVSIREKRRHMDQMLNLRLPSGELVETWVSKQIHDGKMSVADGKRILADMFRGTNANGVRVAKYVDDDTARVMDYLRNNLVVPNHGGHYQDKIDADGNVIGREYVPSREVTEGADELMASNEKKMNELLEKKINGDITEEEDIELLARQLYTPYLFAANARANVKEVRAEGEKMYEDIQRKKAEMGDAYTKEMRDADYAALEANSLHLVEAKTAYDEALTEYNETLGNVIMEGRDNLRMFREGKEAHKAEVVGMAIKAIGGEAKETSDGLTVWERLSRGGRKSIGVTYWTFDTACREIDRFAPNGEGEFYKHFMGGWREASNAFFTRTENHVLSICEAVGRITGSGKDSRRALRKFIETADWTDVGKIRYKNSKGKWEETRLKVSNALFVLAMWDQAQYRDIMTKRGVTQEVIDGITAKIASIDEHYLDFKDWVVQEFLPTTRLEYNEVHKQVFGASMDNIKNYFPAKVVKGYAEEDLNRGEQLLPSTITGSIITRKSHSENIKYNQSFFSVLLNHLQNMDQWASFTPLVEDLTAVLSSPEFSRLANEYKPGVGEDKGGAGSLKQILRETGAIAVGSYTSKADDADVVLRFMTGAWAASNITFRFSTALKQMSGLSAVFTSGLGMTQAYFFKNLFSSIGWAYKNSPMFKKRWGDGVAGNEALLEKYSNRTDIDLKRRKIEHLFDKAKEYLRLLTVNIGMLANRAVDAWVTAVTMRTVYDVTLREITKGKPESATEEQKSYAMMKAEIFANETQQSSEGAYLSVPQTQRSVVTAAATVYMNAPFAANRMRVQGVQDIYRWLNSDYRNEINTRYGDGAARKAASKGLGRLAAGISIDASFILMSRALGQGLWNLIIDWFDGTEDDDDEAEPISWKKIGLDVAIQIATGGYLWLSQIPSLAGGHRLSLAPSLTELFEGVMNFLGWNEYKLREGDFSIDLYWWALGETMFKYGLGVDPETMLNIARGIEGICRDKDPMAAMKILNTPQSMVNIIAGPRRNGETVKEHVERRARLEVLFAQPKFSELYDDELNYIGDDKYTGVGGAKKYRLKSLAKEYNEHQRAAVMSKYLSPSEVAKFERIDSEYKAIVEPLGWEVGNNPQDDKVDKTGWRNIYPEGLRQEHYAALKGIATAAERTRRAQDRWVGSDQGYANLVREEYNLREQLIAGRRSSYKAKTAKEKIDRAEKQRKKNQKK